MAKIIIGLQWSGHEHHTVLCNLINSRVDVFAPNCSGLDPLAFVLFQVGHNLPRLATVLINGNASTGRGQRATEQARVFSFDVKETDFAEIE